ncbi:MAG: Ldh family oxidoreductase, partial [Synergistaceae bacterium]|nr:Ldh family oxidoreductase [Synergistaceae bacterium]
MYSFFKYQELKDFCEKIFSCYGFGAEDSHTITDVLLRADLWGIESHGMQRMVRYHGEITSGMVSVDAVPEIVHETPVSAVIDANKSIGQTVGVRAMRVAIEKAKKSSVGMVSVRNSNHFGIAGYYADMAVREDMIGISMTNSEAIAVPVFGRFAMLGTNPIAVGFPADPVNFMYDASTSVVTRGKVEVFNKLEKPLPDGWAVDAKGHVTYNADEVLHNIINKLGGGIAPLGGTSEMLGGHKGYGFAILVDICSGILSSGMTSNYIAVKPGENNIAHY